MLFEELNAETGEMEWVLHIDNSILSYMGKGLRYFFYPLGCLEGGWTNNVDGWKYVVSTLTGLIAKEDVVATMAELGLAEDTVNLSLAGVYSFAVYNLFTLPCFAAIGAAHGEQKGKEFSSLLQNNQSQSIIINSVEFYKKSYFAVDFYSFLCNN